MQGIMRVAAAVPHLYLANVEKNVEEHLEKLCEAKERNASLVVFPELSLTGVTCGDLFFQQTLIESAWHGLHSLSAQMPEGMAAVVGAPLEWRGRLFSCGVVMTRDTLIAAVPKMYLPHAQKRYFRSGFELDGNVMHELEHDFCLQTQMKFCGEDGSTFAVAFAEDMLAPAPYSTRYPLAGTDVLLCMSGMHTLIGQHERIRDQVQQFSAACLCGCVCVQPGLGESTADAVYGGYSVAAVCGEVLAEWGTCMADDYLLTADIDSCRTRANQQRSTLFSDCLYQVDAACDEVMLADVELLLPDDILPDLHIPKLPFIPENKQKRTERCTQIFDMQAHALARRMQITGGRIVVGISGGLDSTLALLVACRAADILGLPRTNILGITMPCFGTTDWTYQSALELMTTLGVQQKEIRIHESVRQHFRDIGHDESVRNVTYENAQARERTQVLMDISNEFGGIVLGTGDLSEIALGWCTYNGDHMSMYGVNSGVPKTLVRWVVRTVSRMEDFAASRVVLERILDTPISPELLPPDGKGNIAQQTEDIVGPYALHDFFLYYVVRYGYAPKRIYEMCCLAFKDDFDSETILKWLRNFYRRFFTQQFKRNCSPDGVKIGSVGLSPRGDWSMPSDAQAALWLSECDEL